VVYTWKGVTQVERLATLIAGLVGGAIVGVVGYMLWLRVRASQAFREARKGVAEAKERAANIIKEARLQAKEELFRAREQFENETQAVKDEQRELERRLSKREDNLDKKADLLTKKELLLDQRDDHLKNERSKLETRNAELDKLIAEQTKELHRISQLRPEQARDMLLKRLEKELEHEMSQMIQRRVEHAREDAEQEARELLCDAVQRCAVEHTAESVVSTIDIPSAEMKGRIIGREGRNIRAFEKATGVDVIVDDTPGVVVISAFDSVARELGRRSMQKLVQDGRIHPAKIEEVVLETRKELDEAIREAGKQACFEVDVHDLHPKEVQLIGRLKFRTSYGQNVLQHSVEVALLSGIIAGELGLDVKLAKRCGLLHDIGKAVDHEMEGGHPQIGADLGKRYEESAEVVNAIAAHHEVVPATSPYTIIVAAADAISASRPGARRETLERYIKRLEKLEEVAGSFEGVDTCYAIQAGREVRVIVDSGKVDDARASMLCRDIAKQIEKELNYPGEIKVTVLRETRIIEYAR